MVAAFFDIDNTIVRGTSMERIFLRYLIAGRYVSVMDMLRTVIFILGNLTDKTGVVIRSRRPYLEGKSVLLMKSLAGQCFKEKIVPKISEEALARIKEHRSAGHSVVLLSGTLDILAHELSQFVKADEFIACETVGKGEYFTGAIKPPVPYGDLKRDIVIGYAKEHALDLKECFAYGDSMADSALFRSVGNPYAVNPGRRLRVIAKEGGWGTVNWII